MNRKWLAAFAVIAALVAGGLGWATRAALLLEHEQLTNQAAAEHAERVQRALGLLDDRMTAQLAWEDARPFNHYSAIHAPSLALSNRLHAYSPGAVIEPSPLLNADLPPWMLLHFQTDADGWESPQVLSSVLDGQLRRATLKIGLDNVTDRRKDLLTGLARALPGSELLAAARRSTSPKMSESRVRLARLSAGENAMTNYATIEQKMWDDYAGRVGSNSKLVRGTKGEQDINLLRDVALLNCTRNGEEWLNPKLVLSQELDNGRAESQRNPDGKLVPSTEAVVRMTPLAGVWLKAGGKDYLAALRLVKLDTREICQGVVLDFEGLSSLLADEVRERLPDAKVVPVREPTPELLRRSMTALPLALDGGEPPAPEPPGWTALRVGLLLSWVAALVALAAVGLGGWSLLDLSDRRIRFVSAVTHELRSPLTTLRLYLDMLLSGLIRDDAQREEYIRTLHSETDRLTRLVTNVLDFSRLEKQAPQLLLARVEAGELLAELAETWRVRCATAGKELIVECGPGLALTTDSCLLSQVIGNLLDNACKYSREADDRRVWLRASAEGGRLAIEVEDRGPGVPAAERRSVFRPFRRGHEMAATTGGVGLGLALARRWARLLGGKLSLRPGGPGACFRVVLPGSALPPQQPA